MTDHPKRASVRSFTVTVNQPVMMRYRPIDFRTEKSLIRLHRSRQSRKKQPWKSVRVRPPRGYTRSQSQTRPRQEPQSTSESRPMPQPPPLASPSQPAALPPRLPLSSFTLPVTLPILNASQQQQQQQQPNTTTTLSSHLSCVDRQPVDTTLHTSPAIAGGLDDDLGNVGNEANSDDECTIIEPPQKHYSYVEIPASTSASFDDVIIEKELGCVAGRDLPHLRHNCCVHKCHFTSNPKDVVSAMATGCTQCYCAACDAPTTECRSPRAHYWFMSLMMPVEYGGSVAALEASVKANKHLEFQASGRTIPFEKFMDEVASSALGRFNQWWRLDGHRR